MFSLTILYMWSLSTLLQTVNAYNSAVAPGTAVNRLRQAKVYVKFCLVYKVNFLSPSKLYAAMYVQ